MAMGGMNMPRVMKKNEMPGGGHVEYGMGGKMDYGMGGKMDMGHGGDMARAIKIYLMKKGGKTFPDLTGDGKVTFADILKGRKVKLKKKSQAYGGKVMQEGGESDPPRADFLMTSPDIDSAISEEARDLSQAASDRESAFGTSSTDVFMNVGNVPSMPEAEEDDQPEEQPRPGSMDPLQRRGPRLIKRGGEKGLVGGMRQDQEEQVEDFDMDFIFDQTPLPRGEGDTRYSRYQKTMGVKDPRTGVYYYVDSARGFKGPKGKKSLSISSLPEDQRARALKAIQDREMKFAGQSDFYRRQRGL